MNSPLFFANLPYSTRATERANLASALVNSPDRIDSIADQFQLPVHGCWALLWREKDFGGDPYLVVGPVGIADLNDVMWNGNRGSLGDEIQSIAVGPSAWLEMFEDENFHDKRVEYNPKTVLQTLGDFDDEADSLKLWSTKPPHWKS
jgi:hypothetical protein